MKPPAVLDRYRKRIDGELRAVLSGRSSPLYDLMRYHLGWLDGAGNKTTGSSGKALRPTLCLLSCEAVCGRWEQALAPAAALELIHNFSLIHDDIQDDDRERRGRPTVWSLWGKPQAINAGTAMRILANSALLPMQDSGLHLKKQLRIQRLIDETSLSLIEGQYLDISYEKRFDIALRDYLKMIKGKTAALLSCSLEVGALAATDDETTIRTFSRLGQNLGLAFQITDDILGIWGEENQTGKPKGSDILHRKKSLPVVFALEKAAEGSKRELSRIYQKRSIEREDMARVMSILEDCRARWGAESRAERFCRRARKELDSLDLSDTHRQDFEAIIRFLLRRTY
jgi:geranylgeranyl diphosphate synthase type I